MTLDVTSVDLLDLSRSIRRFLKSPIVPGSVLAGKTAMKEATMKILGCSELEAENIVDTLVARGFARYSEHPEVPEGAAWFLCTLA